MHCYITRTTSYLPGPAVGNDQIQQYLGSLDGEAEIKDTVLSMNGIVRRHYAQDEQQQQTHDVYDLGAQAVQNCLSQETAAITYLAAGTTYSPLAAPGFASILHSRLRDRNYLDYPVEISSHAGVCSSAASGLVGAIRAISTGQHSSALAVGAEHASEVLKASLIHPVDDRDQHGNVRNSQWFMSVFLRFMLSDGAGTFLLQNCPAANGLSLRVNWTHSLSFAHETPLCMKLDNRTGLLSQDVSILSRHLVPAATKFLGSALESNNDTLDSYSIILPHMSSFFFRRKLERVIASHSKDPLQPVPYWTDLATAGNTGAASIFVMLDHYLQEHEVRDGERILLFIPESGQFNFVMISLTAVMQ
jgi:3-oxoacyl-[acyl-carrier-protein] synthase-3